MPDFNHVLKDKIKDELLPVLTPDPRLEHYVSCIRSMRPSLHAVYARADKAYMYYSDSPYMAGYVGYGRFKDKDKTSQKGEPDYVVCARGIINNRYKGGDQQSMRMTINLNKAIKLATTFLTPYKSIEMAEMGLGALALEAGRSNRLLQSKVGDIANDLFGTAAYKGAAKTDLAMELQHLVRSGHNFLDKKLQVVLEEYFALVRDAHDDNLRMQDLNATFVACMGTTIGGEQKFETVRVTKVNERYYTRVDDSTRKHYIGTSEIPEDVRGKVSVLSMIPHGQFVNGVGMRVCDTLVYVMDAVETEGE